MTLNALKACAVPIAGVFQLMLANQQLELVKLPLVVEEGHYNERKEIL
jgi:hypothetical protein